MKNFNDIAELEPEQVDTLIQLAQRLERSPQNDALKGKVLALFFLSPSLRTLTSFQSAMSRLGGGSFVVAPDQNIHRLEMRPGVVMDGDAVEHIREALPVICSYADAIGIRAFAPRKSLAADVADEDFKVLADLCSIPYINMESAILHPTQSLADWKTMDELTIPRTDGRLVLSWAYHPKPLPLAVGASTLTMAAMRGMKVTVLRPDGFELPEAIVAKARGLAERSGGSIRETNDRREALEGAHVVYAKSWSSTRHYGDDAADKELRSALTDWRVDESWFQNATFHCRFMHCLPVRRNVVVTEDVLEGGRSVVLAQARNRMWGQMAVLHELMAHSAGGENR